MGLHDIRDHDMTGIDSVHSHMDDRSDAVAVDVFDAEAFHELCVACCHRDAIHLCRHAVPTDLFYI